MRFTSDNPGVIQAIRYYKSPSETGTHVGRIWSATGQQLATVTFTNESASGWQQQALATPLTINAATSYVVSVNTNSYYALTSQGFSSAISNAGLNAPVGAGVYNDVGGVFPTLVYQNENYFRDVVFVTGSSNANNHPGVLSISGTAAQNQTLTATVSDVDGVPASVVYQWQQSANGSTMEQHHWCDGEHADPGPGPGRQLRPCQRELYRHSGQQREPSEHRDRHSGGQRQ